MAPSATLSESTKNSDLCKPVRRAFEVGGIDNHIQTVNGETTHEGNDMALEKQPSPTNGTTRVTFRIAAEAGAERADLLGEFNNWSPAPMQPLPDGGHDLTVELESGHSYRFRYLLDGQRWENDWQADAYVPNEYGGDDSVIDLVATNDDRANAIVLDAKPASRTKRSRRKTPASPG